MSQGWAGGSTRRWRRIRASVLERNRTQNSGRCQIALPGTWMVDGEVRRCLGWADCVHHLDGKARGDNPQRLVAACTPCNLRVGDPTKRPDPAPQPRTKWGNSA